MSGSSIARERLRSFGPPVMTEHELLSILVGPEAAGAVLERHTIDRLAYESAADLANIYGVTALKAAQVAAAIELGRRTLTSRPETRPRLGSPREIATLLLPIYGSGSTEQFGIVSLDTKHRLIRVEVLSTGILDASLVHCREFFRAAMLNKANAAVAFHNHPSGDPTPSGDDVALTARLVEAGVLVGIELVDHVVLAGSKYCSFKEIGRI